MLATLALTLSLSSCNYPDAGTVTDLQEHPTASVTVEDTTFVMPESHSIELDEEIWVDVSYHEFQTCDLGDSYPECTDG